METIALICVIILLFKGVVTDESFDVSLMEGDSVTLHTNTEIQKDDKIEWRFGDQQDLIARINRVANSHRIYADVLDGRFKDRLQVNNQTGDLTITDITTQLTGVYQLDISRQIIMIKTFSVYVSGDKAKTVMVGDSVILVKNVIKKPGDEKIVWRIRHNNSPVAEINDMVLTYNVNGERFRDRLQVYYQTGDLIITNVTTDDSGSYKVEITDSSHTYTIHRSINVSVKGVDPQKERLESNEEQDQTSGLRSREVTGAICGGVLAVAVAVAVRLITHRRRSRTTGKRVHIEDPDSRL